MRSLRDRQLLRDRSPGLRPRAGLRNDYLLLVSCGFLYASSIVPLPRGHHLQRLFAIGFGDEVLFFCEQP